MNKRIVIVIAAALLIFIAAPLSESVALAAQAKRTCSCKPALHRKKRGKVRTQAVNQASVNQTGQNSGANAALVGPVYATYTLPSNQYFRLRMNQTLNSDRTRVGDRLQATVVTPIYASGVEVVPAGSIVDGKVTAASPALTRGREVQLVLHFDSG